MQSYSKGARGLSVLPRGDCIFTNTSTSLSLRRRQCGHRYAIRAGRNLPDKEFRYLRTVIVTADIHGDLGSELRPAEAGLTTYLDLSALVTCHTLYVVFTTWQSAVFLLNSRSHHFTAAPLGSGCTPSPTRGAPYPEVTVLICRVPSPEFSQAP